MKTIIAGSRTITDYVQVEQAVNDSGWADKITEVVCGGAEGVDGLGWRWAKSKDTNPSVAHFRANWAAYGKKAGPLRNEQMAKHADALILVWDGKSKGSADMKRRAEAHGLRIFERVVRNDSA